VVLSDDVQMHLEASSNFYGETVCPFNRKLTSGGSSGGEGALIGMRGSCMGVGTDIGVRLPLLYDSN
jgi:amidase